MAGLLGLFGLIVLGLASCTTDGVQTSSTAPVTSAVLNSPDAPAYAAAEPVTQSALPSTNPATFDGEYKISGRDIIEVSVFQVPDLNKTVQVSEDGSVTLPLVGKVQLAGMTTHEAEDVLVQKLKAKYLQSPQVSVLVKQFGQRVTLSGEVKGPKVLAVDGSTTLSQAIANAGGLTDLADATRVHVARSRSGRVNDMIYNLDQIQSGRAEDPVLQGGDIVVAEQSGTKLALKTVKDLLPFAVLGSIL